MAVNETSIYQSLNHVEYSNDWYVISYEILRYDKMKTNSNKKTIGLIYDEMINKDQYDRQKPAITTALKFLI